MRSLESQSRQLRDVITQKTCGVRETIRLNNRSWDRSTASDVLHGVSEYDHQRGPRPGAIAPGSTTAASYVAARYGVTFRCACSITEASGVHCSSVALRRRCERIASSKRTPILTVSGPAPNRSPASLECR